MSISTSTTDSAPTSTRMCPVCGKPNIAMGIFCGDCGHFLGEFHESPRSLQESPDDVREKPGETRKSRILTSSEKLKRRLRASWKRQGWLMVLGILVIFGLSPILALHNLTMSGVPHVQPERVIWSDLRSILSRRLALTLADVDGLAKAALNDIPRDTDEILCAQAKALKSYLDAVGRNDPPIFKWLPDQGNICKSHLIGFSEAHPIGMFPDVPIDHPVYRAWKCLIHWRIPLSASVEETRKATARPFEPLLWDDWNYTSGKILQLLGKETGRIPAFQRMKSGPVTRPEFFLTLGQMAKLMEIPGELSQTGGSPKPFLSRFEAFSVLSYLLERKEEQR